MEGIIDETIQLHDEHDRRTKASRSDTWNKSHGLASQGQHLACRSAERHDRDLDTLGRERSTPARQDLSARRREDEDGSASRDHRSTSAKHQGFRRPTRHRSGFLDPPKHSRQGRGETQSARSDCQTAEGDEQETEREPMNLCLTLPRPAPGGVPPSRSHLHDGVKSCTTRRRDCQLTAARPVSPVSELG
jgi:hypothetical protein